MYIWEIMLSYWFPVIYSRNIWMKWETFAVHTPYTSCITSNFTVYAAHYAHFTYQTSYFLPTNEAIAKFTFCLIPCENFHNICQRADPGKSFKVFFTACHDFCLPRLPACLPGMANKTFFQHVEPGGWTKCSLVRQLNLHLQVY